MRPACDLHDPADLVLAEAQLLDAGQYEDWLALYTETARYWVPLAGREQADGLGHQSLCLDDKAALTMRVHRLRDPRAHSQHPRSACQHVLQMPRRIDGAAPDAPVLLTPFVYVETQGERQLLLAGTCRHTLARTPAGWRIQEKRVDLLGAGRALPAIQLFI